MAGRVGREEAGRHQAGRNPVVAESVYEAGVGKSCNLYRQRQVHKIQNPAEAVRSRETHPGNGW